MNIYKSLRGCTGIFCYLVPVLGLLICSSNLCSQQVVFTDVTFQAGIDHTHSDTLGIYPEVGGASVADFDNDGWPDIFFTLLEAPDILYRNNSDGTFEDVSVQAGFVTTYRSSGSVWGDIDNDGDLDLYVTTADEDQNYLYMNNGDGTFSEQGSLRNASAGEGLNRQAYGAAMGDYDRDGFLDILTTDYGSLATQSQSRLLRNLGSKSSGYFEDVTAIAGLDEYRSPICLRFTPQFTDLDGDGHTDITMVSDLENSQLFWNNGDDTFVDGTQESMVGTDEAGMGSALADFDGDGDLDWFVTAIRPSEGEIYLIWTGNRLFRNDLNRQFTDVTEQAGVLTSGWAWGTVPIDYDNDGDFDLAATNGWYIWPAFQNDPTTVWENDGNACFEDVTSQLQMTNTQQGRGLAQLDYDGDGDLDLLVVNNHDFPNLLRNDGGNQNNYLRIQLVGTRSNKNGIGAVITVTPDAKNIDRKLIWEVRSGDGYSGQSEMTAHFGLGLQSENVAMIKIQWPSGVQQLVPNQSVNQTLVVEEPSLSTVTLAPDAQPLGE